MISVSVLSSKDRIKLVRDLNWSKCDMIHLDVCDGEFVSAKEMVGDELLSLVKESMKRVDIHLMCYNPLKEMKIFDYYPKLKKKIRYVTVHYEIDNLDYYIKELKRRGYKVGIAINHDTNEKEVFDYFKDIDFVIVMSVPTGVGGSKFIDNTIDKIRNIRKEIDKNNYEIVLSVDGGIKDYNAASIYASGADNLVVGSYVTNSKNLDKSIIVIRKSALKELNLFFS